MVVVENEEARIAEIYSEIYADVKERYGGDIVGNHLRSNHADHRSSQSWKSWSTRLLPTVLTNAGDQETPRLQRLLLKQHRQHHKAQMKAQHQLTEEVRGLRVASERAANTLQPMALLLASALQQWAEQ